MVGANDESEAGCSRRWSAKCPEAVDLLFIATAARTAIARTPPAIIHLVLDRELDASFSAARFLSAGGLIFVRLIEVRALLFRFILFSELTW
jgi:hypothetical protein